MLGLDDIGLDVWKKDGIGLGADEVGFIVGNEVGGLDGTNEGLNVGTVGDVVGKNVGDEDGNVVGLTLGRIGIQHKVAGGPPQLPLGAVI